MGQPDGRHLVLDGVTATRGSFVLGPIDIVLPFGKITAVVGANGAGKTTLARVLLGQIPMREGRIVLNDRPVLPSQMEWRATVGFLPDDPEELLAECTAEELWQLSIGAHVLCYPREARPEAKRKMLARAHELAEILHFQAPPSKPIAYFSLGMRKKTQLIAALATMPEIVLLDEPRNGLDPIGMAQTHRLLLDLAAEGKLVIVSTHDLSWAMKHSQQIIAISLGRVTLKSDTEDVIRKGGEDYLLELLR
ncbi:MAG: ABC transporter ATP-binding protein [Actinobacteria bacterium]|nr:ABC transporter ATP-binding protein [Actinomycetota bacterium]MCL5886793.1 ABC transporter ATP-binding protein [Actinomycetota bacterium]